MAVPLPDPLRAALRAYAAYDRVVVGTDFDGVLAPLVDDPSTSSPVPGSIDLLRRLAGLPDTTVAVVSGRDLETLGRLTGIGRDEPVVLIGSHGAESSRPLRHLPQQDAEATTRLREASMALESVALAHPGTRVEHKQAGVVLHTRGLDRDAADRAAEAARRVVGQVPGTHLMAGKNVVEIAVFDVSKGAALTSLRAAADAQAVCYLGDDRTDEFAFQVLGDEPQHLTIKVGLGDTAATHRIPGPAEVVELFEELLVLRHPAG